MLLFITFLLLLLVSYGKEDFLLQVFFFQHDTYVMNWEKAALTKCLLQVLDPN